jgi:hypothetical protein
VAACGHYKGKRADLMSPELMLVLFSSGIVALACVLLGGISFLIRQEPLPTGKPAKKIVCQT